jgi:hypothetical protein
MHHRLTTGLAAIVAGLLIWSSAPAQEPVPAVPAQGLFQQNPQNPPPVPMPLEKAGMGTVPRGVEVLGKGPVHEGYAKPMDDLPRPGPLVTKQPPAPIDEVPPDQKPEGAVWIPGYWQYDEDRSDFVWVSGFYRVPPPGRQWTPGRWQRVEGGYRWVAGYWPAAGQTDQSLLPQPPASRETGPLTPAPQDDAFYVPGNWQYQDGDYRWRPGFWSQFRPGWVWNPAQYTWTPNGYNFCDGYWDYPLERRGLLSAACAIDPNVLGPGFSYTPNFLVSSAFLPSSLFVRNGHGHYYYGDYRGGRPGFDFWGDFRYGQTLHDPLFGYYRVANRGRGWEQNLRTVANRSPLVPLGASAVPSGMSLTRVTGAERALMQRPATVNLNTAAPVIRSTGFSTGPTIVSSGALVAPTVRQLTSSPIIVTGPIVHTPQVVHTAPVFHSQSFHAATFAGHPSMGVGVRVGGGGHAGGHGGHR